MLLREENYLVFFDGVCDKAEPAAVLDFALVRLSRSTEEAADAARFEVCFVFLAINITSNLFIVMDESPFRKQLYTQTYNNQYEKTLYIVLKKIETQYIDIY